MNKPLGYSVKDAAALIGCGQTRTWQFIAEGTLPAKKIGGRTIVLARDIEMFLESAPAARPAKAA